MDYFCNVSLKLLVAFEIRWKGKSTLSLFIFKKSMGVGFKIVIKLSYMTYEEKYCKAETYRIKLAPSVHRHTDILLLLYKD